MAQGLYVTASRTKCTRPAFGGKTSKQPLNATLATAATATGTCLARDLADGLRIALVNGLENRGRLHLIAVANQRIRRLRPHLLGHFQYVRHRVKRTFHRPKKNRVQAIFETESH